MSSFNNKKCANGFKQKLVKFANLSESQKTICYECKWLSGQKRWCGAFGFFISRDGIDDEVKQNELRLGRV